MKAACFMKHGGPEVMQYGDVPDPAPAPGQGSSTFMRPAISEGRHLRGKLVFKVR